MGDYVNNIRFSITGPKLCLLQITRVTIEINTGIGGGVQTLELIVCTLRFYLS
jgi:hypothetical protein